MMNRIFLASTFSVLMLSQPVFADDFMPGAKLDPQPGQWSTMIAILDSNNNHYLLKTTVNDNAEACATQLHAISGKVKQQNDMVFTNPGKTELNYEKQATTPTGVKVLELRCVREPFTGELVQKF